MEIPLIDSKTNATIVEYVQVDGILAWIGGTNVV